MSHKQKILIVDDKPENVFSLELILRETGTEFIRAGNVNDALMASLNHDFALALLDVQMPEMEGYEIAELLRSEQRCSRLPIIFISAVYSSSCHVFRGYDSGAVDFLVKPIEPKILLGKVKFFLQQDKQQFLLKESEKKLFLANNSLELEVSKRTSELEQTIEKLKMEVKKRKLAEKINLQAHKMEAIGSLASGIAHDFNNILSSILGFTELSLDEVTKGSTLEEDLQQVYSAGIRAKNLVQQILTFSRQTDEKPKPVRVDLIISETAKFLRSAIPSSIEIKLNMASKSLVLANPVNIHQLVMNLCTNAAYAISNQGLLELSLHDVFMEQADLPSYKNMRPGLYQRFVVSDNGCGITEDILDSIFHPFFTTKDIPEGTGMGLAMIQGVVQECEGDIQVESLLGRGTVFTILFPVTDVAEGEQELPLRQDLPKGEESILLVDDEQAICKMASRMLEGCGYHVTSVTDSEKAYELFKGKPDFFDLVITDMTMPKLSGDQLMKELLLIREDIPIIVATGYHRHTDNIKKRDFGAKTIINKPFKKSELIRTVKEVLKA